MRNQNSDLSTEEREYYSLVKRVFAVLAPCYDAITLPLRPVRSKVADLIGAGDGAKALDVATGTGGQAFAFARKGYDVTGIDLSEAMLKVASSKSRYNNVRFQVADATSLPFEDYTFDVSAISFALHDMPSTIRGKILKEMARVTKAGGTIVIVDYALPRNRIGRFLVYHFTKLYESKYYVDFINSDIEELLREYGIRLEATKGILFGAGRILKGKRTTPA